MIDRLGLFICIVGVYDANNVIGNVCFCCCFGKFYRKNQRKRVMMTWVSACSIRSEMQSCTVFSSFSGLFYFYYLFYVLGFVFCSYQIYVFGNEQVVQGYSQFEHRSF